MDFAQIFTLFVVLLISLTFHEAAHAFVALKGGDQTAYRGGQVTLNPVPHIRREPFGMVILPLILLVATGGRYCIGFASTPIDPYWAHRHPKKAALMSAAGPLSNFLLAAVAFAVLALLPEGGAATDTVHRIALVFLFLNVLLGMFNLFPLPPLDGAGIVEGLVPKSRGFIGMLRSQQMFGLMGLIVVILLMREIFPPVFQTIRSWLP